VLHAFANGLDKTRYLLRIHPGFLMPLGLSISLVSALIPLLAGQPFLTGVWYPEKVAIIGSLGTALFFDIGVYLVVVGATLTIIFSIAESS
jgi:multicomponent Na+:H+ antiporter subunit B